MTHDPMNDTPAEPRVVSEDRAKQGRRGLPVLAVLVVAVVLSGLAMAVVYLFNHQNVEQHNARQATDAEPFDMPEGDYARQSPPGQQPPEEPGTP
ncbi:hypothetical protein [Brevundimonas sp.]|uniref:hypothetical protein n=1 Tax=Brevundimonas sp. TaxID=1871086 RepID=UPI0025D45ABD|nr:hypothetical protein [Brevundimonas sp.]